MSRTRDIFIRASSATARAISAIDPVRGARVAETAGRIIDVADAARGRTQQSYASGYSRHAASRRANWALNWITSQTSPADDIDKNAGTLRERSRDLYMGGSLPRSALNTIVDNVTGPGLMLDSKIDHVALGISRERADELERQCEREFRLWADNEDCTLDRSLNFSGAQSLVLLSALMNGDVFVAPVLKEREGRAYDLRLNIIEADLISTPFDKRQDRRITEGIESDASGAPVAYYVCNQYPRSGSLLGREWKRVSAFGADTGRRNMLHIMAHERPGQKRGVPLLAPVIADLKQLTRYSEAELTAAVISAYFTVFVESDTPDQPFQSQFSPDGSNLPPGESIDEGGSNIELAPGAIISLGEGESAKFADPSRPNTAYEGFVTAFTRQIGAAVGVPFEVLTKHFQSSYSASRGALLEAEKTFRRIRSQLLIGQFCTPVYEEFLAEAVATGRIVMPGFFTDPAARAAWSGSKWYGIAAGQLDPLKEANAAKVRVEEGFSTRAIEAAELSGATFEHIHEVRAREEQMRRDDGLAPRQGNE